MTHWWKLVLRTGASLTFILPGHWSLLLPQLPVRVSEVGPVPQFNPNGQSLVLTWVWVPTQQVTLQAEDPVHEPHAFHTPSTEIYTEDECVTINALMDSSYCFDTINLGWSIVYNKGSQVVSNQNCFSFSEDGLWLSEQCRPWWNAACCSISSGSSLFTH